MYDAHSRDKKREPLNKVLPRFLFFIEFMYGDIILNVNCVNDVDVNFVSNELMLMNDIIT